MCRQEKLFENIKYTQKLYGILYSYPMGTEGSYPGDKAAEAWSWSLPHSAEVKNAWSYTSSHLYVIMARRLVKHRDNITLPVPYGIPSLETKPHNHTKICKKGIIYVYICYWQSSRRVAAWRENCKWYSSLSLGAVV
jgi:hypothetical protein